MYRNIVKMMLDFTIALIILPVAIILFVPIAILIKMDDGGPIFYNGKRLGKNLMEFPMFKFRTMKSNSPDIRNSDGSTYNSHNDSRLTKIGGILRKTSLDEIPQIINVLKGDMSLIGPRPSPLGNQDKYSEKYLRKFTVKPGITGFNQVMLRNNASPEERERNDLYYIENVNFYLDLKIIWLTVINVLISKNINRN